MQPKIKNARAVFLALVFLFLIMTLVILPLVQAIPVRAETAIGGGDCALVTFGPTVKPTGLISHLCGRLVYLTYTLPTNYGKGTPRSNLKYHTIGLIPCSGTKPLIFQIKPRQIVPYYQLRDAQISAGREICTKEYGCLDQYIATFQNFVGIKDCLDCRTFGVPPTWTKAPLTPYTPTSPPPTPTYFTPTPTETETPTLSPSEMTPTLSLFEALHGTFTPTSPGTSLSVSFTPTPNLTSTPIPFSAPAASRSFWLTPLVAGLLLAIGVILLAYWSLRTAANSDQR
jgi:hypothetical protein